ncbi:FT-interacting protein 1 [Glycine soja]
MVFGAGEDPFSICIDGWSGWPLHRIHSYKNVEQRIDATPPTSVWHNLQKRKENEGEEEVGFSSKLNMRISSDGGYHVLDEITHYTSDLRPTSKYLSKPSFAKYGPKWVKTRTIIDSLSPKWNEQYTWEVYDPCTVITIVVFDNGKLHSLLSAYKPAHTRSQEDGGNSIGCELDSLRNQVAAITTLRFKRAEAPLSKEVVEYMLDAGENVWSMRRGRAQFHRIAVLLNVLVFVAKHFDEKKITTVLSYFMFLYVVFCPWIILPSTILFLLLVGIWCYRTWPRYPSHTDIKLSHVDTTTVEELEEEFDNPFPSKFSGDNLRTRLTLPHSSLW